MMYIQLFLSFFQIGSLFSFGRWICGTSTDPGAGRKCASLAQHDGIYGSDHHFPDDSGTDRDQCSNLCWNEIAGMPGAVVATLGCITAILYYRDDHCKIVLEIPGNRTCCREYLEGSDQRWSH